MKHEIKGILLVSGLVFLMAAFILFSIQELSGSKPIFAMFGAIGIICIWRGIH